MSHIDALLDAELRFEETGYGTWDLTADGSTLLRIEQDDEGKRAYLWVYGVPDRPIAGPFDIDLKKLKKRLRS
jgi:hypothetical protein